MNEITTSWKAAYKLLRFLFHLIFFFCFVCYWLLPQHLACCIKLSLLSILLLSSHVCSNSNIKLFVPKKKQEQIDFTRWSKLYNLFHLMRFPSVFVKWNLIVKQCFWRQKKIKWSFSILNSRCVPHWILYVPDWQCQRN